MTSKGKHQRDKYAGASTARQPVIEMITFEPEGRTLRTLDPYVSAANWNKSVAPPWDTITLQLSIGHHDLRRVLPTTARSIGRQARHWVVPDGWIVIRTPHPRTRGTSELGDGWPAVMLGRIDTISAEIDVNNDGLITTEATIQCESWVALPAKNELVLTPGTFGSSLPGFFYNLAEWGRRIKALWSSPLIQGSPGPVFAQLWRDLALQTLPEELGGEPLGEAIPLVHDRTSSAKHAPLRLPQMLRVPGWKLPQAAALWPRGTLWAWFEGLFSADPDMVELFPSLELPCTLRTEDAILFTEEDGSSAPINHPERGYPEIPDMSKAGKVLGSQPVLVYRLKPRLTAAITQEAADAQRASRGDGAAPGVEAGSVGRPTAYGQEPVQLDPLVADLRYYIPWDQVFTVNFLWADGDRVNATHSQDPFSQKAAREMYGLFGVPRFDARDIERNGLRFRRVEWPFFGQERSGTPDSGKGWQAWQEVCHAMLSCNSSSYYFARAQVELVYRPEIDRGFYCRVGLPPGVNEVAGEGAGLIGYIESVGCSTGIDEDAVWGGRTHLTLSSVSIEGWDLRPQPMPEPEV